MDTIRIVDDLGKSWNIVCKKGEDIVNRLIVFPNLSVGIVKKRESQLMSQQTDINVFDLFSDDAKAALPA